MWGSTLGNIFIYVCQVCASGSNYSADFRRSCIVVLPNRREGNYTSQEDGNITLTNKDGSPISPLSAPVDVDDEPKF